LAHAAKAGGQNLEWSEHELIAIERACSTADRAQVVQGLLDAEAADQNRPTIVAKLSNELRQLDRLVVDLVGRVHPGEGQAKSERHKKAAVAQ
jgi:hypothetical protein